MINKDALEESLQKEKVYSKYLSYFKNYNNKHLLANLENKDFKYIGLISKTEYKRDLIGKSIYCNGNRYFGNYNENIKQGIGVFANKALTQIYSGWFSNDKRQGIGITAYSIDGRPFVQLEEDKLAYGLLIGYYEANDFKSGFYLIKETNDVKSVYYGGFNKGKRHGDKCFLFQKKEETLFYGKIENDQFKEGIIVTYDTDQPKFINKYSIGNGKTPEITSINLDDSTVESELKHCKVFLSIHNKVENVELNIQLDSEESESFWEPVNIFSFAYNVITHFWPTIQTEKLKLDYFTLENIEKFNKNFDFLKKFEESYLAALKLELNRIAK